MKTRTRPFLISTATVAVAFGLLGGGITSAHAEMQDPPVQADVESSGGGVVLSFDRVGGVPPVLNSDYHLFDIRNGLFFYAPSTGNFVSMAEFTAFAAYKGGTCMLALDGMAVACSN